MNNSSNIFIYNHISIEILKSIIKHNKNVTFYVYGQTGSGKTHTILGDHKKKGREEEKGWNGRKGKGGNKKGGNKKGASKGSKQGEQAR